MTVLAQYTFPMPLSSTAMLPRTALLHVVRWEGGASPAVLTRRHMQRIRRHTPQAHDHNVGAPLQELIPHPPIGMLARTAHCQPKHCWAVDPLLLSQTRSTSAQTHHDVALFLASDAAPCHNSSSSNFFQKTPTVSHNVRQLWIAIAHPVTISVATVQTPYK